MSVGSLKVKIFDGKGTNVVPVAKSTVTVGSAPHCDVVLEHASIQAEHVRAWLEGGRIWIQDLGTSGGTFLNGIRLPGLKPMLVRSLDVLKLGECPATIGMEANLVRAPMVKAAAPVEEHTVTEVRPPPPKDGELEKRRDDLAKVSRELAELRLQLQMGRLEKTSSEELRKQLNQAREEMRLLTEQRDQMTKDLEKLAVDQAALVKSTEQEIARKRQAAESEIKMLQENTKRKTDHWKVDMVAELGKQVNVLGQQKAGFADLESDLNQLFRQVLLQETPAKVAVPMAPPVPTQPLPEIPQVPKEKATPTKRAAAVASAPIVPSTPEAKTTKVRLVRKQKLRFQLNAVKAGLAIATLSFLGLLMWMVKPSPKLASGARSVASTARATPTAALPAPPPPPVPTRFSPHQTKIFKKTYTENVLYTENYAEAEFNQTFHQRWIADLSKAGREDWHIDDKVLTAVAARELQLIQDLQHLKDGIQVSRPQQGIAAMRARENAFQAELESLLRSPEVVERYHRLKHAFYTRNQQYLVKQTR